MEFFSSNPNVVRTYSGLDVDPMNPDPKLINIIDIAHALSYIPRFGGHSQRFYSVAEHSIGVYELVKHECPGDFKMQLAGLMHDASEAYLLDIPQPVKYRIKQYLYYEYEFMEEIARKFGFHFPLPDVVKSCDKLALRLEWYNYMMPGSGAIMHAEPFGIISGRFLKIFDQLTNKL